MKVEDGLLKTKENPIKGEVVTMEELIMGS
jgi:hypothetical protein